MAWSRSLIYGGGTPPTNVSGYDIIAVAGDSNCYSGSDYNFINESATDFTLTSIDSTWDGRTYAIQQGGFGPENGVDNLGWAGQGLLQQVSFAVPFSRDYYIPTYLESARTGTMILATGWGGTGFGDGTWNPPSGAGYVALIARMQQALALSGTSNRIKCLLIQIGTNDIGSFTTASYISTMQTFVASVRAAVSLPDLPVVVGGNPPFYVDFRADARVQDALAQMPQNISRCAYANPYASNYPNTFGNIPYNSTWPTTNDVNPNLAQPGVTISNITNNGGAIQITIAAPGTAPNTGVFAAHPDSTFGVTSGTPCYISGVVSSPPIPGINAKWASITVDDATHVTLDGSTFSGTYTSGGVLNMITDGSSFLHFGSDAMRTGSYSLAARYFAAYQSILNGTNVNSSYYVYGF